MKIKSKSGLRVFDLNTIRSWKPCYDPNKHLPENWRGTAVDILRLETVPHADRLWVVLRTDICSTRTLRLFAVWCARQVQHLMMDPRSINALDVAERFANGNATQQDLNAAVSAAWYAAWSAAKDAAKAAASTAAEHAQRVKLIEMLEADGRERIVAKRAERKRRRYDTQRSRFKR